MNIKISSTQVLIPFSPFCCYRPCMKEKTGDTATNIEKFNFTTSHIQEIFTNWQSVVIHKTKHVHHALNKQKSYQQCCPVFLPDTKTLMIDYIIRFRIHYKLSLCPINRLVNRKICFFNLIGI